MTMQLDRAALIVVDVQNDFCPGGALAVAEGDAVIPVINRLLPLFAVRVFTQDWHPADHLSFADSHAGALPFSAIELAFGEQVLWPARCGQGSQGAAFDADLDTRSADVIIRKGFRREIDSYSAFHENDRTTPTGLAGYLRERGVEAVWIAGLATDYCVAYSALDAVRLGLGAVVIEDACRAIDLDGSLEQALTEMQAKGVGFARSETVTG